jgi:hypothetical protein
MTTTTPSKPERPASKLDTLERLLRRKNGTSIAEMTAATSWQVHSVRGAMAGALKKRGHTIVSDKIEGTRHYRIAMSS